MTQLEKIKSIVGYEEYKPIIVKKLFDSKVFDFEAEEALLEKKALKEIAIEEMD